MLKTLKQKESTGNLYEGRVGLVYARVSSASQESDGDGRGSQDFRCQKDLASIGVPYEKSFMDTYTGGGDFMNRPAMRELLGHIDAHPYKKYVVDFDDLKRFARDVEFHLKLKAAFKSRDVLLRCLNYKFDDSPEGLFVETIFAAQNQLEREQNRRQVIQKQRARLENGYWPFPARRPFKMNQSHILEAQYPDTEIVRKALEGFADGTFVRKIDACRFLVAQGFWKKRGPEKYIDKFTELAQSPLNAGFVEYLPWEVSWREGKHQGFISLETYLQIQKRLKRDGLNKRIRIDMSPEFPMRGLTLCDCCGNPLTGAVSKGRTKRYSYYVCHTSGCRYYGKSIRKVDIEGRFKELLKKNTLKKEVDKLLIEVFDKVWKEEVLNVKTNEALLTSHKAGLENKIAQLTNTVLETKSPTLRTVYEKQLEKLAAEVESQQWDSLDEIDFSVPYRTALEKSKLLLKSPYVIWECLNVQEQHRLFFFIFDKKLSYDMELGYRTEKSPTAITLFEDFVGVNTLDVEMGGIEPPCSQCEYISLQA